MAVNQFTGKIYVANFGAGSLSVINPASNAVTAAIPVGSALGFVLGEQIAKAAILPTGLERHGGPSRVGIDAGR